MKIVYIDDDADDREFFSDAVTSLDPRITCTTFESSEEGLAFLKSNNSSPDVVFVDMNMPKMNGYETVRGIRSVARLNDVPVVILTTSLSAIDITNFNKAGIRILIKPNKMENLAKAIKGIIMQAVQVEEK